MTDESVKICALCGTSCDDAPRIKDSTGRYYHDRCYMTAQRARWRRDQEVAGASSAADAAAAAQAGRGEFDSAQDGNDTMMSFVLDESHRKIEREVIPETTAAAEHGCRECGTFLHPAAVVCTRCGADVRTGEHLQTEIKFSRRKRRLLRRFDPLWRIFDQVTRQLAPGAAIVFALLFISSLIAPEPMLKIFLAFVIAVLAVLHLCLVGLASRESIGTGAAVLLIPLYSVLYFLDSPSKARRAAIWSSMIGIVLLGASFGFSSARDRLWSERRAELNASAPDHADDERDRGPRSASDTAPNPPYMNDALATDARTDP
jgi:hypothetical protein